MEVIVVALLVLPPVLVGIVGWSAARLGAREERRSEALLDAQRAGYARLGTEEAAAAVRDRRAA
jgi:Tfp pilus assembly protein PilX